MICALHPVPRTSLTYCAVLSVCAVFRQSLPSQTSAVHHTAAPSALAPPLATQPARAGQCLAMVTVAVAVTAGPQAPGVQPCPDSLSMKGRVVRSRQARLHVYARTVCVQTRARTCARACAYGRLLGAAQPCKTAIAVLGIWKLMTGDESQYEATGPHFPNSTTNLDTQAPQYVLPHARARCHCA